MTDQEKMQRWIKHQARNPVVQKWLKENPPPKEWEGTEGEWAYTEMPQFSLGDLLKAAFKEMF